eukprot:5705922-Pyramimonas_sp.AAC.1
MSRAERLANLCLKVARCKVVPLANRFSPVLCEQVKAAIKLWIPCWSSFAVVPELLYLGLWLGPAAGNDRCWVNPIAKLRLRALAIAQG